MRSEKVKGMQKRDGPPLSYAKYGGNRGSRAGCRRKIVMFFVRFYTGRPAPNAAMPVLFLLSGPKNGFFSHRRCDTLPDKRKICQI